MTVWRRFHTWLRPPRPVHGVAPLSHVERAWGVRALEDDELVHIVVDGEEDLLVIVAVLYAPEGSLVVYGQPGEGIVVVRVTGEKRAEAVGILKAMEIVRKAK